MLPFFDDKKIYQCFVCGVCLNNYEEFKNHFNEDHEEGREYIKCPIEYCKAPVRDLKIHFENKHKSYKLPKNCQIRASVWFDVRSPSKKKKPAFQAGNFPSDKNGKSVPYRSGMEKTVYQLLEKNGNVVKYEAEPFTVPYFFNGKQKNYIPDLLIEYIDGRKELAEIKPVVQVNLDQNKAKFNACSLFCHIRGINFRVITEQDIEKMKIILRDENAKKNDK